MQLKGSLINSVTFIKDSIEITWDLGSYPDTPTVFLFNPEDGHIYYNEIHASENGDGTWNIVFPSKVRWYSREIVLDNSQTQFISDVILRLAKNMIVANGKKCWDARVYDH